MSASDTIAAGVLPPGLWFRNSYLSWFAEESGWPEPTHAVLLGPFPTVDAARPALAATEAVSLPAGYPLVLFTDDLGLVDEAQVGVVVVTGLFTTREGAEAWRTGHSPPNARVEPLLMGRDAWDRMNALPPDEGIQPGEPRRAIVQIVPGDPVPAYPRGAVDAAEEAFWNWETEETRGPDPMAQPPAAPLCVAQPGAIFLVPGNEMWAGGRRWAPVYCGDVPAYVPRLMTTLESVVYPLPEGTYRMKQVGDVSCDVACFCEWTVDADGRRVVDGRLEDACDCPPSCEGGDSCS